MTAGSPLAQSVQARLVRTGRNRGLAFLLS